MPMTVTPLGGGAAEQPDPDQGTIEAWTAQFHADHGDQAMEVLARLMSIARSGHDTRELARLAQVHRILVGRETKPRST